MSRTQKYQLLFFAILFVGFGIMSYNRGMSANLKGDYHIYWEASRNFVNGTKFYTPGVMYGGFTYPPFAAIFFSFFSVFPFYFSAFVYTYVVNFGLWLVSLLLVKRIFNLLYPNENINVPLILASLLSIGFYWDNFIWMNANLPVFCCTLLGIKYYISKKFNLSYLFFLAGTFFKITPVIFLIYAAIKRSAQDWPKIILMAVPFILVPMLLRGFSTGLKDWHDYYDVFIAPISQGRIDKIILSLGVPSLFNKLNTGDATLGFAPLLHLTETSLKTLAFLFQVIIITAVGAKFLYDKYVRHDENFNADDLCILFLVTLLLPVRVWTHHHVCAAFIYTYVFILLKKRKVLYGLTIFLCLVTNIITEGEIGAFLNELLRQYSYISLVMLFVSVLIVWLGYFGRIRIDDATK